MHKVEEDSFHITKVSDSIRRFKVTMTSFSSIEDDLCFEIWNLWFKDASANDSMMERAIAISCEYFSTILRKQERVIKVLFTATLLGYTRKYWLETRKVDDLEKNPTELTEKLGQWLPIYNQFQEKHRDNYNQVSLGCKSNAKKHRVCTKKLQSWPWFAKTSPLLRSKSHDFNYVLDIL